MDNFFSLKMLILLNFDPLQEINWAKICSKMQTLSTFCGCKNLIIQKIRHTSVRYLIGLPLVKMLAQSDVYYWSDCPKPPKIGFILVTKQKDRGMRKVKPRTGNTKKLRLMDPEAMDRCSYYYSLYENFVLILWPAPGGNLGHFWPPKMEEGV